MVYCGLCRARLKPISPRVREDILSVAREENKRLLTKLTTRGLLVIAILSFWGYSQLKGIVLDSAQKDLVPRILNDVQTSTDVLIRSKVETAVNEAANATLPKFQSALRLVQQKHETEVARATQQTSAEIREAAVLAKQQINDATQKTVTQISTTTIWTSPSSHSAQISSATDPYIAEILKGSSDRFKTPGLITNPLRPLEGSQISTISSELTTRSLSNASDIGCIGIISAGTGIETASQRSTCSKTLQITIPSLTPLGSGTNEPLPSLPTTNTKY